MDKNRIVAAAIGAFALVGSLGLPAQAADSSDLAVTGSTLTITNPSIGDFSGVTLDGTAKQATATMDAFTVTDARGVGTGWNVTVGATQFAEWAAGSYVVDGKSLPTSSLSMPLVSAAKTDVTSSGIPTVAVGPYTIDSGSSVEIANAAADGTGMGSYTLSQGGALTLAVPASAYERVYRSDVTVSVNTGP
jgi:hypothetical protein